MIVILIITIIFFLIINYRFKKRNNNSVNSKYILLLVYISSFVSTAIFLLVYKYEYKINFNYYTGYIYLVFLLLIFFYPIFTFNERKCTAIIFPSYNFFKVIIIVSTSLSLYSLIYYLTTISSIVLLPITEIESARLLVSQGENPFLEFSLLSTIASLIANFFVIQILIFYIYMIKNGLNKKAWIIFISTFSYPLLSISYLGRDGFVFWALTMISMYFYFKRYIPKYNLARLKKITLRVLFVFFVFFMFITIGRFDIRLSSNDKGVVNSIFSYFGQGPINFVELFNIDFEPTRGVASFKYFFNNPQNKIILERSQTSTSLQGVDPWTFKTFVGNFLFDFGKSGTLIFAVIIAILFRLLLRRNNKNTINFSTLLIYFFYYNIVLQGVFYFRQYSSGGNIYIFFVFILFIIIKLYKGHLYNLKLIEYH